MKIDLKDCKIGFILKGEENHKPIIIEEKKIRGHYIVFYEVLNGNDFIGCMITSTDYHGKNIEMMVNHFREEDEFGKKCKVVYQNSYLVHAKLHKFYSMGPFELVGQFSEEGINFMIQNINELPLLSWDEYNIPL